MEIGRWLAALRSRLARLALFGVPLVGLAAFLAWEVPRISPITYRQTDALPIFLALRALVAGSDPYALSVGAQAYRLTVGVNGPVSLDHAAQFGFHYPLPPAFLYLPISLFPSLEAAAFVTRALTAGLYLAALLCLTRRYAPDARPLTLVWLLLWGIAWWPFLAVILPIIQPTGMVMASLAFCLLAAGSGQWFWAGFALFFALLKPQDALPALAVLAIWGALRAEARWRLLAGFCAAAGLPTLVAFLWRPDWLMGWLSAILALPAHIPAYYQNPLAALVPMLGAAGILAWASAGVLVIAWLALVIWGALRPMNWPLRAFGQEIGARRLAPRCRRLACSSQPTRRVFGPQALSGECIRRIFSRARDPQWGIAVGTALALALLPRTGGYEIAIGLLPWFYAWQWAGEVARRKIGLLLRGLLAVLWLACGALAYTDHGFGSGVAFGVSLLLVLGALMALAPDLKTDHLTAGEGAAAQHSAQVSPLKIATDGSA